MQQLPLPPRTGDFGEREQPFECQFLQTDSGFVFRFSQHIDRKDRKGNKGTGECACLYILLESTDEKIEVASAEMACKAFF